MGITIVPNGQRFVILRLGKFLRIADPGINFLIPILDSIAARFDVQGNELRIPHERGELVIRYRVLDPKKAYENIADVNQAVEQSARTVIKSMSGTTLTDVFARRTLADKINAIVENFGVMVTDVDAAAK